MPRLTLTTIASLGLCLLALPGSARELGWRDLTDFSYLPDLAPLDLRYESGRERLDDQGRPLLRRDANNRVILLEATGPGVLIRFFGSDPGGQLYFLRDGQAEPSLRGDTAQLFRWGHEIRSALAAGKPEPAQPSPFLWPLSERTAGLVSHVLVPFEKSLVVLADRPVPENNYEFTWIQLPAADFTGGPALPPAQALQALVAGWRDPGASVPVTGDLREVRGAAALGPGDSLSLCDLTGAGVLRSLRVTLDPPNPMWERQLILRCWWDGADRPAVQVPLGDLCGRQWGQGLPGLLGGVYLRPDSQRGLPPLEHTLYLRFPLPFTSRARVELQHLGDATLRRLSYQIVYSPAAPPAAAGRLCAAFHAGWWGPGESLPLAELSGGGKLVALAVATWGYPQGHPWDWRQDFDPVLTVDGEVRVRGNGLLSPLYGGATPLESRFDMPYPVLAEPRAVGRQFLLDAVPFRDSLQVRVNRFPERAAGCRYTALAAWYAPPTSPPPALPIWQPSDLSWPTIYRQGAIEAEDLAPAARVEQGEINVVLDTPGRFFLSGRRLVTLVPHSPNARFHFRLPLLRAGKYRVLTRTFHSVGSQSLWEMEVNGRRSEHNFMGFYSHFPGVGVAQNELDDWGVFELAPEANRVVLLPKEDYAKHQALTNYLYCLDAFLLIPEA